MKVLIAVLLSLLLLFGTDCEDAIAYNTPKNNFQNSHILVIQPEHVYFVSGSEVVSGLAELAKEFNILSVEPIYDRDGSATVLTLKGLIVFVNRARLF